MIRKWILSLGLTAAFVVPLQSVQAQDAATDPLAAALTKDAVDQRSRLNFDGKTFSGPAWDKLLSEGRDAQFFC